MRFKSYEELGIPTNTARDVHARLSAINPDGSGMLPIPFEWDSMSIVPEGDYKQRQPFGSGYEMDILMTSRVTGSLERTHIVPDTIIHFLKTLNVWCKKPIRFQLEFDICYPQLDGLTYSYIVHDVIIPKLNLNFPIHDFVGESFDIKGSWMEGPIQTFSPTGGIVGVGGDEQDLLNEDGEFPASENDFLFPIDFGPGVQYPSLPVQPPDPYVGY